MGRSPLTARGIGALLLAVACFVLAARLGLAALQTLGVLLILLVLASLVWVFAPRRRPELARRIEPATPAAGTTVRVDLRLDPGERMRAGRWQDALTPGLDGDPSGVASDVPFSYLLRADARGVHHLGPLAVTRTDPFGIARRTVELKGTTRLLVTPVLIDLAPLTSANGRAAGAKASTVHRYGQGSDDVVARPWAVGDSLRRIHWRATAHRGEPMVRQEERETSPEATVVLDTSAMRFDAARFEAAVTAAVSAAARLVADGYAVEVTDAAGHPLCDRLDAGDRTGIERMLLAAAVWRPGPSGALHALTARFAGDVAGPLVLLTGVLSEPEAAGLSELAVHTAFPVLLAFGADPATVAAARGWRGGAVADAPGEDQVWASLTRSANPAGAQETARVWASAGSRAHA